MEYYNDYNFMLLGVDFDFFLITFECKVRFQKSESLNRSKFYHKSDPLIKIYVSSPLEQGLRMPWEGIEMSENLKLEGKLKLPKHITT